MINTKSIQLYSGNVEKNSNNPSNPIGRNLFFIFDNNLSSYK